MTCNVQWCWVGMGLLRHHALSLMSRLAQSNTLLLLACEYGHTTTAELLMAKGADVEAKNNVSQSPQGAVSS